MSDTTAHADESNPFTLHHIGIVTTPDRYDAIVRLLVDALDARLEEEGEDEELDIRAAWILLRSGVRFEVVCPRSDREGPIATFLERTGGGLHHVSFETESIGECRSLVSAGGARVVGESDNHAGWAEFFVDPKQTGGALLHWMQALT